jgi:hypothetical protein
MNSTLTSLVNDVYTLTNRPDLVGETILAVRNATLKAHRSDFYPKDIFETGIQFDYSQAQQSIEFGILIPRWRALKYVRKYIPDNMGGGTPGAFLDVITPEEVLDSYNVNRDNVAYVAGLELKIRSSEAIQYALLGCYILPDVTPSNYNSWIANSQPSLIIYEAAATVFKTIGYDEQNATYARMVLDEYAQLKQDNILGVGY